MHARNDDDDGDDMNKHSCVSGLVTIVTETSRDR